MRLRIDSAELLGIEADRIISAMHGHDLPCEAFLIESMIEDRGMEMLVSIRRIPEIGFCLVLASGGIFTNLIDDAQTVVLPASYTEIQNALKSLRMFPVLEGWRGRPGVDIDLTVNSLLSVCQIAESMQKTLAELEINPYLLRHDQAPIVLDAVIRINPNYQ